MLIKGYVRRFSWRIVSSLKVCHKSTLGLKMKRPDKYKIQGVNVPIIDANRVLSEKLCIIINPIQKTGIIKINGLMKMLPMLIKILPVNASSEAFLSWNMLSAKNKEKIKSVNAK